MNDGIEQKVKQIASDLFDLPIERISAGTSTQTVAKWDSVLQLSFVLALEQTFAIELEPADIERMLSVGAAIEIVRGRLARD
jgi:acyl carrier protein